MDAWSDDTLETEINRPKKSKASPRPRSSAGRRPLKKSSGGRGLSPYKNGASHSATSLSTKHARDLWLSALKTGTGINPANNKAHKGKRTTQENWTTTLRQTGVGFTSGTSKQNLDSFSGLSKAQTQNMAYASTTHFLRQKAGVETTPRRSTTDMTMTKPAPGTPAYKTPEEYYDEVLALKKQIQGVNTDNSTLKLKIRRLEEDNIKKEKQIDQLLDPSKSEEMRRTLSDKRPDTSTVIHSLKQKILKLEHQLKDKETDYNKLQSDLKTTKIEEMRIQAEALYKEVLRLNQLKTIPAESALSKTAPARIKETPSRLKALQETIMRMNEKSVRLQSENKTLKEDLTQIMDKHDSIKDNQKNYEDMNKKELLASIGRLERKLEKSEAAAGEDGDFRGGEVEGKIVLEGSMKERLDQLDKRETELLEDLGKQRSQNKRLREHVTQYRKKADEKDKQIRELKKEVDDLQHDLDAFYSKDGSITPRTPRHRPSPRAPSPKPRSSRPSSVSSTEKERQRRIEDFRQQHAAKNIQKEWRRHHGQEESERLAQEHAKMVEDFRQKHAAASIQKQWRRHQLDTDERARKVHQFTENRAARHIQHQWQQHRRGTDTDDTDDATELIQGAMRAHTVRRKNMTRMRGYMADDLDTGSRSTLAATESEVDDATEYIQTNMRAHQFRKEQLHRSSRSRSPAARSRHNVGVSHNVGVGNYGPKRLDSTGEEDEEDTPPVSARDRRRASSGRSTPRGRRTPTPTLTRKKSKTPPPLIDSDDEDSDGIIFNVRGKKDLF